MTFISQSQAFHAAFPSTAAEEVYVKQLELLNQMWDLFKKVDDSKLTHMVAEEMDDPLGHIQEGLLALMGALKSAAAEAGYET
jgi:hypothetical protein